MRSGIVLSLKVKVSGFPNMAIGVSLAGLSSSYSERYVLDSSPSSVR